MPRPLDELSQQLIIAFEGFRALPYDDKDGTPIVLVNGTWRRPNGAECLRFPTIGYGQRIWDSRYYGPCTKDQARSWFVKNLESTYLPAVDRDCPGATDHQRGAFTSFCYNCGPVGLVKSGLPEAFVHGASQDTLKKLWTEGYGRTSKGVIDPGLIKRRAREWVFFCTPDSAGVTETHDTAVGELHVVDAKAVLASVWATADALTAELVTRLV